MVRKEYINAVKCIRCDEEVRVGVPITCRDAFVCDACVQKDDAKYPSWMDEDDKREAAELEEMLKRSAANTFDVMSQAKFMRRSERIQVAGRLLASFYANRTSLALLVTNKHDEEVEHAWQTAINDAVTRADALLTRIDETEVKPKPVEQIPQPPPSERPKP